MESFNKAESFEIGRIALTSSSTTGGYDIKEQLIGFVLEESILDGLATGSCVFMDSLNIINSLKLSGNEFLHIVFKSSSAHEYSKKFQISRVESCTGEQQNSNYTKLIFSSIGALNSMKQSISKSYACKGVDFIVTELLNNIGRNDLNIEKTLYNKDIIIPNMNPIDAIAYLRLLAISAVDNNLNDSNFYFFESDKINFISGMGLLNKQSIGEFVYYQTPPLGAMNAILKLFQPRTMNAEFAVDNNTFGVEALTHSITNKTFKSEIIKLDELKKSFKPLNPNMYYKNDFEIGNSMILSADGAYNMGGRTNTYACNSSVNRASLGSKKMFIEIAGSMVRAGDIIDIAIIGIDGSPDRNSGRWLVQRAVHNVTPNSYTQELEIISDSNM